MPSSPRSATPSGLSGQSRSKRLAIRRRDLRISEPVLSTFTHTAGYGHQSQSDSYLSPEALGRRQYNQASSVAAESETGSTRIHPEFRNSGVPSFVTSVMSAPMSKSSVAHRRDTGFRATLRRMFGGKPSSPDVGDASRARVHAVYSDLQRDPAGQDDRHILQISPHNRSIVPAHPDRHDSPLVTSEPLQETHPSPSSRRRRNTLPSLVLTDEEARAFSSYLDDGPAQQTTTPLVSSVRSDEYNLKRKSRSTEALVDRAHLVANTSPKRQDRKGEIALWRNSIMSSSLPDVTVSHRDGTDPSRSTPTITPLDQNPKQTLRPLQSFDFDLGESHYRPPSLEQRVNTLEVKLYDFEYAIAKLQGIEIPKPPLPAKAAKRGTPQRSHPDLVSDIRPRSPGQQSVVISIHKASAASLRQTRPPVKKNSNDDTLESQRVCSGWSQPDDSTSLEARKVDQISALIALVQDEKAARQQMEMRIMDLKKEVELLQAPVYASIRPIPRSTKPPEGKEYHSPPTIKALRRSPKFTFKDSPPQSGESRFSMTESDAESDLDLSPQDVYQTPQETHFNFETPRASALVGMI